MTDRLLFLSLCVSASPGLCLRWSVHVFVCVGAAVMTWLCRWCWSPGDGYLVMVSGDGARWWCSVMVQVQWCLVSVIVEFEDGAGFRRWCPLWSCTVMVFSDSVQWWDRCLCLVMVSDDGVQWWGRWMCPVMVSVIMPGGGVLMESCARAHHVQQCEILVGDGVRWWCPVVVSGDGVQRWWCPVRVSGDGVSHRIHSEAFLIARGLRQRKSLACLRGGARTKKKSAETFARRNWELSEIQWNLSSVDRFVDRFSFRFLCFFFVFKSVRYSFIWMFWTKLFN